jgi:iron complex outermembrane recepter protein
MNPSRLPIRRPRLSALASALALAVPTGAFAQANADTAITLPRVVVTGTLVETPAFDVPASIDRIEVQRGDRAQVNISESLGGVAGLTARDRQNYAQDVQISVRGFGARSSFGIRGVRLYVDGIPATFPDGQGQISNVDLGSAERIEVLRGPFSALYGNSSGGVLQVFTEEPSRPSAVEYSLATGSNHALRIGAKVSGIEGSVGYVLSASHFETDGYRAHSAARRDIGNVKLTLRIDEQSKLSLIANSVDLPQAQDPLGLRRDQMDANRRGVDPSALAYDTRKTVDQSQGGLIYERRLDAQNTLRAMVYTGHRNTRQFQSILVGAQTSDLSPGGVIALGSDYRGTDLRWTLRGTLAERPFTLVTGLAYDLLDQHRLGYRNFTGVGATQVLGVQGERRRDEQDSASNVDEYVQATVKLTPAWSVSAGLRHSSVRFESADHYAVGSNPDDSGAARYSAKLPVLGVMYAVNDSVHLYATAGRGFETPTFNELAYRPNGATGLNFALQPAHSNSLELGAKTRLAGIGELNAALFETRTRQEIVTLTNGSGRATYQNVGATRRTGVEIAWSDSYADDLRAQVALTYLDAVYRDKFGTCNSSPCTVATQQSIPAGNRIPGIARGSAYAAVNWAPPQGWQAGIEVRAVSHVYANDLNTEATGRYGVFNLSGGYVARLGPWQLSAFVRSDNLFDRRYVGSVIVNDGNSRFFEPAPGRTWLAGTTARIGF